MKEYFDFNGTAKRSEYWAMIVVGTLAYLVGVSMIETLPFVALALMVLVVWYALATTVRRVRDSGNSLWWLLALLVPGVGTIASVVFGLLPTQE